MAYSQNTTDRLLSDPDASRSSATLEAYARMMVAQANLLASHTLAGEAEQTLRLADRLAPGNPEVVFIHVQLLAKQNRRVEAWQAVGETSRAAPGNAQFQTLDKVLR